MYSIAITTECVADLPKELYKEAGVDIIYYDIETDTGIFRDTDEIDAENVMEYIYDGGGTAKSITPTAHAYKNFFKNILEEYDEIIHLCNSSLISIALENASLAKAKLGMEGRKIHLVDSRHLSTGLGLMVLEAAKQRNAGMNSKQILAHLEKQVEYVNTSFLVKTPDFLIQNKRVGKHIMQLCKFLHVHPAIYMKNGQMKLWKFYVGKYEKAIEHYIADVLYDLYDVDPSLCILTYAGCSHEMLEGIRSEIVRRIDFKELLVQPASATVSCNCGPLTFGIIHYTKRE